MDVSLISSGIAEGWTRDGQGGVTGSGETLPDGSEILQVDTYPLMIYAAAAVQELNRKLASELRAKDAELQALKASVAELQTAVRRLAQTAQEKD